MRRRADNGGDYLAARCTGGRGNTTYTPGAGCIQILISGVPRKYIKAQTKQISRSAHCTVSMSVL